MSIAAAKNYNTYLANARALVSKLHIDPRCVVFTMVPNFEMDDTLPWFLAEHLGRQVVAPRIDGLSIGDHYHLTEGARIWSKAFLNDLEPIVQECVGQVARNGGSAASAPVAALR